MHKEKREFLLFRLAFMILFGLLFKLSLVLTVMISLIQWIILWFQDEPVLSLSRFSRALIQYQRAILEYLSFQSDEKVFPFRDWPSETD